MELMVSQVNMTFVLPERIPLPKGRRFQRAMRHLDGIVYAVIRERRSAARRVDDLLQVLLDARDESGECLTDEQLRGLDC
jgi:cytochrome P450